MKVLVLGIDDFSHLAQNTYKEFKRRFSLTYFFNVKKYRRINKYLYKNLNLNLFRRELYKLQPNLIFIVAPYYINKKYFEVINEYKIENNCVVSGWIGDKFDKSTNNEYITKSLEIKFITDSAFRDLYDDNQIVEYLPLCTSLEIFYNKNLNKSIFCSFIASTTAHRENYLKKCTFPIEVYGTGWENLKSSNNNSFLNINAKKIDIYKTANIYNQSNLVLNLKNETNVLGGLNQRTFDPFLCDALVLQENCIDLEFCFEPNKEIVIFNNYDELNELAQKFSKDNKEFKIILENGKKEF